MKNGDITEVNPGIMLSVYNMIGKYVTEYVDEFMQAVMAEIQKGVKPGTNVKGYISIDVADFYDVAKELSETGQAKMRGEKSFIFSSKDNYYKDCPANIKCFGDKTLCQYAVKEAL